MRNGADDLSLDNLTRAVSRLKEALESPDAGPLVVDGTIQRFEFVVELLWKTLKRFLSAEGVSTATPRETIRKAFKAGWIHDEELWLQMLEDRNLTSHIYDEETALGIYRNIGRYLPEFERILSFLEKRS